MATKAELSEGSVIYNSASKLAAASSTMQRQPTPETYQHSISVTV